jgi:hypothetical protein
MGESGYLIIAAIIGLFGNIIATVGASFLNQRANRKAQEAARDAAEAAAKAQIATEHAARDAANAARALVEAAKTTDARLTGLQKSADENMDVTRGTHTIVNSQRTAMEEQIDALKGTVAGLVKKLEKLQGP